MDLLIAREPIPQLQRFVCENLVKLIFFPAQHQYRIAPVAVNLHDVMPIQNQIPMNQHKLIDHESLMGFVHYA